MRFVPQCTSQYTFLLSFLFLNYQKTRESLKKFRSLCFLVASDGILQPSKTFLEKKGYLTISTFTVAVLHMLSIALCYYILRRTLNMNKFFKKYTEEALKEIY